MPIGDDDELAALVPELSRFNSDGDAIRNWLEARGQIDDVLVYSTLFWPTFRTFHGSVFLRPVNEVVYDEWMKRLKRNAVAVQKTLNHVHLADFFGNSETRVTTEKLVMLGRILVASWGQKLKLDFPAENFEVVLEGGSSPNPTDVTITFSRVTG